MNDTELFLEYEKCKAENTALVRQIFELEKEVLKLQALEEMGVDNWEGYGEAMELLREWKNER